METSMRRQTPRRTAVRASAAGASVAANGPQFGAPEATPDPTKFLVKHASDAASYKILDREPHLPPLPFDKPVTKGPEPILALSDAFGSGGPALMQRLALNKQIVFHAVGDTGNTRSTHPQSLGADKMVSDFDDQHSNGIPAFCYHLGDVVYSFGEAEYYYDQFYEHIAIIPRRSSRSPVGR
jgi:hypothetical protein